MMNEPTTGPRKAFGLAFAAVLLMTSLADAQEIAEAYRRADQLRETTQGKVFRDRVVPHWFANNDRFWYRNDLAEGRREFVVVDATTGERKPAFDHVRLITALGRVIDRSIAVRLPFDTITIDEDGSIRFAVADKGYRYRPGDDTIDEAEPPAKLDDQPRPGSGRRGGSQWLRGSPGSTRSNDSPDDRWTAFVEGFNVHLRARDGGETFPLSSDGVEGDAYESGVFWSPDSSKLVAMKTQPGDKRHVTLVESSPRDQLQPKTSGYDYLKPGDRVAITKPHLFDVAERKTIPVPDDLFSNPWSLDHVRWSSDGRGSRFCTTRGAIRFFVWSRSTPRPDRPPP